MAHLSFVFYGSPLNGSPLKKFFSVLMKLPALIVAILIWLLSSQRTLPRLKGIFGIDKLQHLLIFAALTVAMCLWVPLEKWKTRGLFFMVIAACAGSLYGMIDEVHQFFVPGRDSSLWDWIADTLGAAIGAGAAVLAGRLAPSIPQED
jgi:VanZ family protein